MTHAADDPCAALAFPPGFAFGAATSAYQVEGAVAQDGRGASVWDTFCRRPGAIADGSSGAVACDHYHRWAADLDLARTLGLRAYRFSVAWPRVQPTGRGAVLAQGLDFYDRLVDGALARGLAPHLTLHHWDLPQALQDAGGWAARDTAHRFADHAEIVGRRLGDRCAAIATHNEPWVVATLGHETGVFAPGLKSRRTAVQVSHHLLLSHGLALAALRAAGVRAPLGIVLNLSPVHAATPADAPQAALQDGLLCRWYLDPLLRGHYPADVLAHLGADTPQVQPGDAAAIAAPLDWLGVNYYTRNWVGAPPPPEAERTDMGWEVYPEGLVELLLRLKADHPALPPVFLTENGASYPDVVEPDSRVRDAARTRYLQGHLAALHRALQAGVDVRGYFAWSLLDNFEWAFGFTKRFGLVHVDWRTQARTPKDSARWYRDFIARQP